jgi:Predicted nucleotidyltransferases
MTDQIEADLTTLLQSHDHVKAAWLFGSVAKKAANRESDLDVAVLGDEPLSAHGKMKLIEELAQATGRAVDLIDLQATRGPIVDRILHDGVRLFCDDTALYAELMKRWWFDRADWRPYRRRILKERRERWIES